LDRETTLRKIKAFEEKYNEFISKTNYVFDKPYFERHKDCLVKLDEIVNKTGGFLNVMASRSWDKMLNLEGVELYQE